MKKKISGFSVILYSILFFLSFLILTAFQNNDGNADPWKQTGIASYYASKFNGRRTASGQIFNNDSLTAAHKTLAFGSKILVRNLKNDSVVVIVINDRLPSSSKRLIDLSYAAAKQLNFIREGLVTVTIEKTD